MVGLLARKNKHHEEDGTQKGTLGDSHESQHLIPQQATFAAAHNKMTL
jgi:hypothetical protein